MIQDSDIDPDIGGAPIIPISQFVSDAISGVPILELMMVSDIGVVQSGINVGLRMVSTSFT